MGLGALGPVFEVVPVYDGAGVFEHALDAGHAGIAVGIHKEGFPGHKDVGGVPAADERYQDNQRRQHDEGGGGLEGTGGRGHGRNVPDMRRSVHSDAVP